MQLRIASDLHLEFEPAWVPASTCLFFPYAALVEHKHISARAVIGALIAVAGVGLLFSQA